MTANSARIESPTAAISLDEQIELELRYDGPIPPTALADLRACPPARFTICSLNDRALAQWSDLARHNVKNMQGRLCTARRTANRAYARWCLRQCVDARKHWQLFAAEAARRRGGF